MRRAGRRLRRLAGDMRGTIAIEFAFSLPILVMVLIVVLELGRGLFQATAIEKGLRNGALFAARSVYPLTAVTETTVGNLARTGTPDGSGPMLAPGWADTASNLAITSHDFAVGGTTVPVIRLVASVPFTPMFPGLTSWLGVGGFTINLSHEQAYVGD